MNDPVESLQALQTRRRFCIKSQSRCDRSCESYIVHYLGPGGGISDEERRKLFKQASAFRKKVEGGERSDHKTPDAQRVIVASLAPLILASAAARAPWDRLRTEIEKDMGEAARGLPAHAMVESTRGFGALGLGIIVGEAGDLAHFATVQKLWKYLGLAVIGEERQQRHSGDAALLHKFNPARRAEIWMIGEALFRHQWRGEKDGVEAHPAGPYGEDYARRRARTAETHPEWSAKHARNDAVRYVTKCLLRDLWCVWNGREMAPRKFTESEKNGLQPPGKTSHEDRDMERHLPAESRRSL